MQLSSMAGERITFGCIVFSVYGFANMNNNWYI